MRTNLIIPLEYSQLLDLATNSKLMPGQRYKITDFRQWDLNGAIGDYIVIRKQTIGGYAVARVIAKIGGSAD